MSSRRRVMKTPKRRRGLRPSEDDLPLSLLAFLGQTRSRTKKRHTPPKRAATVRAATVAARSAAAALTPSTPSEVINLDEFPESEQIVNNVNEKIGMFMQSGSFISSDEDETDMTKTKTKKALSKKFFISDDSDDDCKMVKKASDSIEIDDCEPSTSAGTSNNTSKENKIQENDDDIMGFVESVLDSNKTADKESPLKDMKSLEDFRKETEEMLKNASSLLDEIKTGRRPDPQPKEAESSPKVTVGSCPICLESLVGRPASVTVCGHIFCKECITHTAQAMKKCPTCRKNINLKKIHPIYF